MPERHLSWQPGFSLSRKPAKRPTTRRTNRGEARIACKPLQLEFIIERPNRNHETNKSSSVTNCSYSKALLGPTTAYQANFGSNVTACEETRHSTETPFRPLGDESLIRNDDSCDVVTTHKKSSYPISIPPTVLYNNLFQRFQPILDRYNDDFCKIPLTTDLRANPFQYRKDLDPEPACLVHAVMGLAGHHVESRSSQSHRHVALQMLREGLSIYSDARDCYSMLDTIIIIFSLDETQSALGNWKTHLLGAYGLLEACGGFENWTMSSRLEVQIGLLTWWDAIISLVSREVCVFPYTYFEAIQSNNSGPNREWDYFGLCGCPLSLVKIVMRLARLSAKEQISDSVEQIELYTSVISGIEQSLEAWNYTSHESTFDSEESMHQDQDRMHCSEAWRNGLLLYIYRVFYWKPGSDVPMRILYRARVIVDHIFACRDENMVSRQALLPLIFAGCELTEASLRQKIIKRCSVWNDRTRYYIFSSAIPLLEEVWAEQEKRGFENVWWGQIVDRQHMSESHNSLPMRICFG
ncbi:fungal-specific transcription factor domain-containing protein [Talaromyces proteolyticus]|uniref:Fungal-specific transcription factor domain-containing protein n=1 Tax=Talaromyces proteolyticus TaxID=1131652 RepID=A0AAD4KRJ2_9EURO|nr:fungal-specific transcription factor domain-containing protein [Talaromyces proteolyticus]KAH8696617.1 fungal-specific transcription factor domain-containing protein [Talaromyces proteolyticus]